MVGWRVYLRADYRDSHATNRTTGLYATYGDTAMSALAFSWGIAEKLHVLLALPLPPVNINLTHSGGGMSSESQKRFSFRIFCSTAYSVRN